MLYDPKWEAPQVKADPFSLESLIAWLEKMPAHREYCYMSNGECLLARYFSHCGYKNVSIGGWDFAHGETEDHVPFPKMFNDEIAVCEPHTFGAALSRAKQALAERS